MTKRRRRPVWAWTTLGLLVVVTAADSIVWWIATAQIEAQAPDFVAAAAQSGWLIDGGAPVRSGWPLVATVRYPSVTATRPLGTTNFRWTAAMVDVSLRPWEPRLLQVTATGRQTLAAGTDRLVPIEAALTTLRVPLAGGAPVFELRDVVVQGSAIGHGYTLHMQHATGQIEALAAGLTADGIMLSPALQAPFDGPLALTIGVNTTAAFPEAASPGASAAAWQRQGGRITVPSMQLTWGPLRMTGSGAGGLDTQLQPELQARMEVAGAPDVVDALGRAGLLAQGPASAARAVLSLLTLAAKGGMVPLPVTIKDRVLTLAQFPMLRLPALDWDVR